MMNNAVFASLQHRALSLAILFLRFWCWFSILVPRIENLGQNSIEYIYKQFFFYNRKNVAGSRHFQPQEVTATFSLTSKVSLYVAWEWKTSGKDVGNSQH